MKKYVFDASVILTFLLGENLTIEKKYSQILTEVKNKKAEIISSPLLPLEVGNGLRYTLKDKALATEVLEKFSALPINYFQLKPAHYPKILKSAYQTNTSFYDTSYHFIASILKGIFLTCDNEYFKKAKNLGRIKLL